LRRHRRWDTLFLRLVRWEPVAKYSQSPKGKRISIENGGEGLFWVAPNHVPSSPLLCTDPKHNVCVSYYQSPQPSDIPVTGFKINSLIAYCVHFKNSLFCDGYNIRTRGGKVKIFDQELQSAFRFLVIIRPAYTAVPNPRIMTKSSWFFSGCCTCINVWPDDTSDATVFFPRPTSCLRT